MTATTTRHHTTPGHRARIWKSSTRWLARRPKLTLTGILIERRDFDTYAQARAWACKRPPSPNAINVVLGDSVQAARAVLRTGFGRLRSDFTTAH